MYDGEWGIALEPMQGNRTSSRVDVGYTELLHFLCRHQCPSRLVRVFLGILWISIKEIRAPYLFYWEHGIALHAMQGNLASSLGNGEFSWFFSSCSRNLVYILELRRGWSFKTCVCSVPSGHLSSYDGHLGNLN